jgi:hypothetical protein
MKFRKNVKKNVGQSLTFPLAGLIFLVFGGLKMTRTKELSYRILAEL